MKAAILNKYDKNEIDLTITEVNKPVIKADEVLVKLTAAGVNPVDNMISRGEIKLIKNYKLPLIAGNELVGVVEAVGAGVTKFKVGVRVFARLPLAKIGAFAQYAAVASHALAKVPDYLTDIEAAAVPLTALTVMQALELMQVTAGKTIFISGGTGGVGAMAIPLAKAKGLTVVTNGNGRNRQQVLDLGADRFIDYKQEDYTKVLAEVDYVLDTLGGKHTAKQMTILKAGGQLVSLRGLPNGEFAKRMHFSKGKQLLFTLAGYRLDRLAARHQVKYHFIFVESNGDQLQEVADIFTKLKVKPLIDTVYPFEQVNQALDKVANGHSRGKTVLSF